MSNKANGDASGKALQALNADTVDGCHAWELQTVQENGVPHAPGGNIARIRYIANGNRFKLEVPNFATAVDYAKNADTAPWSGISGKPTSFLPSGHSHLWGDIVGTIPTDIAIRAPNLPSGTIVAYIKSLIDQGYRHASFGVAGVSNLDSPGGQSWGTVEYVKTANALVKVFWYNDWENILWMRTAQGDQWHSDWASFYSANNNYRVSGSYVGDGQTTKAINLGFAPAWVTIGSPSSNNMLGGGPTATGFEARNDRGTNTNGTTYNYIAFK